MKRKDIVKKLMSEGFSEKTLAGMTDKQLTLLKGKILPEQTLPGKVLIPQTSPTAQKDIALAKTQKKTIETYEGIESPKLGSDPEVKDTSDKEATIKKLKFKIKHEKDKGKVEDAKRLLAKLEKKNEDLNERSRPGGKNSGVRGGSMGWGKGTKNGKPLKKDKSLNEWVNEVVGKKVYPFTSKNEIMDLIHHKINEGIDTMEPEVKKKEIANIPEFLTYDEIKNAEVAEPIVKPAQPTTKPGTKPGQPDKKPGKHNPYQPGPGINPGPKASIN